MKQLLPKHWTILLLVLIPLWISLACITITGDTSPDSAEQSELTVEADVVFGPGLFIFPDPKAGLADLAGYKTTLTRSFDGTRDGQAQKWSQTHIMLTTKEPAARQLTVERTGDLNNLDPIFLAEADGAAYERHAENVCTANVIDLESSTIERLDPIGYLNFVVGAEEAGSETVNDVAAEHYTFDERAFGQLGFAKVTGEMWVASEGGYIVKYLVTTTGNAETFGEGIEGVLTLDYELTEVNQMPAIELPADCPAGMVDAPLLPDAANVLNMPSVLAYDTASSLADAAAFYQEQIPALGWTMVGELMLTDTSALLNFTQGNQEMRVLFNAVDGGTKVHIVFGRAQE
jgi:hypothetical protein